MTTKDKFRPEDKRLLNRFYGPFFKADVFKSVDQAKQEETRTDGFRKFLKKFEKVSRKQ